MSFERRSFSFDLLVIKEEKVSICCGELKESVEEREEERGGEGGRGEEVGEEKGEEKGAARRNQCEAGGF